MLRDDPAEVDDWRAIQGIQIEGQVSELLGGERARAEQRYVERFPFVRPGSRRWRSSAALARVRLYRLRIVRLFFIDNGRGFGQREQFDA